MEGRRGSQRLADLKEVEVIPVEGSEEASGLGPQQAGGVPAVPGEVCRPTWHFEGVFPFCWNIRIVFQKSMRRSHLVTSNNLADWQERTSLEAYGNSHTQRDDFGPRSSPGSWSGYDRNQRLASLGYHCHQDKSAPAVLSNFITTAWDSLPREEMPGWPSLNRAPSLGQERASSIVGSVPRLYPQTEVPPKRRNGHCKK